MFGDYKENLAMVFQELLTNIVRMRAGQLNVSDGNSFRRDVINSLEKSEKRARARGYSDENVRLAQFAVVVFLDNVVMRTRQPAFAAWQGHTLETETFKSNRGGELFFQRLDELLRGQISDKMIADVLEVYYLCLLLGYKGELEGGDSQGPLQRFHQRTGDKIREIRGSDLSEYLSPTWQIPVEALQAPRSRSGVAAMAWQAGLFVIGPVVLFIVFKVWLHLVGS